MADLDACKQLAEEMETVLRIIVHSADVPDFYSDQTEASRIKIMRTCIADIRRLCCRLSELTK